MSSSDSDKNYKYPFCWPRRCFLCRFSLARGELICVVAGPDTDYQTLCHEPTHNSYDESGVRWLRGCHEYCTHDEQALGCHQDCLTVARRVCEFTPDLIALATGHAFDSPITRDELRRSAITNIIIHQEICPLLPQELRAAIAEHLVRTHAIVSILLPWGEHKSADCTVDTSREIWASYVRIENVRYLARLSNTPEPGYFRLSAVSEQPRAIYISHDHLGIRRVTFSMRGDTPAEPGVWWHTLEEFPKFLRGVSDGLKLRRLEPTSAGIADNELLCWPTPLSAHHIAKNCTLHSLACLYERSVRPGLMVRMHPVPFSGPHITGYSVCWQARFIRLHSHSKDESLAFYEEVDETRDSPIWQYFPVDDGEDIIDIWRRRGPSFRPTALMFRSSKGRMALFGPCAHSSWEEDAVWTQLAAPSKNQQTNQQTTIYCDQSHDGIRKLGIAFPTNTSAFSSTSAIPKVPQNPQWSNIGDLFYSAASLANVESITPCLAKPNCPEITGLLLRYLDGSRVSVGNVRLDRTGSTLLRRYDSLQLYLGFATKTQHQYPFLGQLTMSSPQDTKGFYTWLTLPFSGEMEFWFSYHSTYVRHGKHASLPIG